MTAGLRSLLENLRAGGRLAALRAVHLEELHASDGQLALLGAVRVLLAVALTALWFEAPRVFEPSALHGEAFAILFLLLFACAATRWLGAPGAALRVAVALLAADCWLAAAYTACILASARLPETVAWLAGWMQQAFPLWWAALAARLLAAVQPARGARAALCAFLFALAGTGLDHAVPRDLFWFPDLTEEMLGEEAQADFDVEAVFHAQADLVARATASLAPGRPGVADLYFVAFGSDATQEVFLREVHSARELFDRRFDTAGRSVVLANHRSALAELPLASGTNLGVVLRAVGERMDPREDVLFLFLTGHGSRSHELAVNFPPFPLNPVDPPLLARLLEESGVGSRVVVVSACYSGGFVEALKGDDTLVLTAAAADRRSFGCSNEADFTYFGDALFGKALEESRSFSAAFESARARVSARERAEGKEPSQPQLAAGDAILRRLAVLERRLRPNGPGDVPCRWCEAPPQARGE